jgi:hypothetical protein
MSLHWQWEDHEGSLYAAYFHKLKLSDGISVLVVLTLYTL